MRRTPIESRLFTLIVGSFTAGVFEEIIWRAYGFTMPISKIGISQKEERREKLTDMQTNSYNYLILNISFCKILSCYNSAVI